MTIAGSKGLPPCAQPDQDSRRWTNPANHDEVRYAQSLCRSSCLEARECLLGAVERGDYGVWGGMLLCEGRPTVKLYPGTFSEGRDDIETMKSMGALKHDLLAEHVEERNAQVAAANVEVERRRREVARFSEFESRQLVAYLARLTVEKTPFRTEPEGDEIVVYAAA